MPRLVLVGGGHSHIEVLRRAARDPLPAETVLVDPYGELPYTGMVPGYIAGLYRRPDIVIDVHALCVRAGAALRSARVDGLDPSSRRIFCDDGGTLSYDALSIDIGSTLDMSAPGAPEHALPVRPLRRFVDRWPSVSDGATSAVIVGAGAAGIELALAVHRALHARGRTPRVTVIGDAPDIAPSLPRSARERLAAACAARDIALRTGTSVKAVHAHGVSLDDDAFLAADCVIWATGPAPHPWLRESGLAIDERGFLVVDAELRVQGRSDVFAAGDVASFARHPRPKSGVYAVRAAPVLAANLRRALSGRPLRTYTPQPRALALIGTADCRAVGVYGAVAAEGRWLWWWKDRIDRGFVQRYRDATEAS